MPVRLHHKPWLLLSPTHFTHTHQSQMQHFNSSNGNSSFWQRQFQSIVIFISTKLSHLSALPLVFTLCTFTHLLPPHWFSGSLPHPAQGVAKGCEPNHTGISDISSGNQMLETPSVCRESHSLCQKFKPTVIQQLRHWFNFCHCSQFQSPICHLSKFSEPWLGSSSSWMAHITTRWAHSQVWSAFIWHLTNSIIIKSQSNLGVDNWSCPSETISLPPSHQVIHFKIRLRPNRV